MRNIKLLIVDNEPDINLSLKVYLEDNSFDVDTFEDPITALVLSKSKRKIEVKVSFQIIFEQ